MKKELKIQHPALNVTPIDILAQLDPSKSNKYLPFLINHINKGLKSYDKEVKDINAQLPFRVEATNFMNHLMMNVLINHFLSNNEIRTLHNFHELLEENRIDQPDITKYKSFEELQRAVDMALIKFEYREKEKGILILVDNDEYLVIRPLTYEASTKYGASTKWCTASNNSRIQFDEYTRNGILIYMIRKESMDKVAIHLRAGSNGSIRETTFWDVKDSRIDATEAGFDLMMIHNFLQEVKKDPRTNYDLAVSLGIIEPVSDKMVDPMPQWEPIEMPPYPQGYAGIAIEDTQVGETAEHLAMPIRPILTEAEMGLLAGTETTNGMNPCLEIPLQAKVCNLALPETKQSRIKKFFKGLHNPFKRKKNIFVFAYHTYLDTQSREKMIYDFNTSHLKRDYEMVIFDNFVDYNLNDIARIDGENIPNRG
jgi:hypothetical protein